MRASECVCATQLWAPMAVLNADHSIVVTLAISDAERWLHSSRRSGWKTGAGVEPLFLPFSASIKRHPELLIP